MNQLTSLSCFSQKHQVVKQQAKKLVLLPLTALHGNAILALLTEQICLPYAASIPTTLAQAHAFIERQGGNPTQRFAIEHASAGLIGTISYRLATQHSQGESAIISYWIATQQQRQGYAQQALRLLIKHLKQRAIFHLQADVYGSNVASQVLLKKMGFSINKQMLNHHNRRDSQTVNFHLNLMSH